MQCVRIGDVVSYAMLVGATDLFKAAKEG